MKKILAIITTAALLASLTACNGGTERDGNSLSSDRSTNQSADQSENESVDQASDQSSDSDNSEPDIKALIESFGMDDFPAPDGTILKKADATLIKGSSSNIYAVGYEFSYVRKLQPVFRSTADDPEIIDWDTLEFKDPLPEVPDDLGYFKIKPGDVLDNGLTVKSAEIYYGMGLDGIVYYNEAEFDGEITLEGALYRWPEDDYTIGKGDVWLFPDAIKYPELITPYREIGDWEPNSFCDPSNTFAVEFSGTPIRLGNESELPSDISELFRDKTFLKAKVTLTDLSYRMTTAGVLTFGELVDAEPL